MDNVIRKNYNLNVSDLRVQELQVFNGEFDPGSGRTLAACLIHASRAELLSLKPSGGRDFNLAADG